ncbi:hypothetical protein ACO0LB_09945 [Undibacterium sp. SXout7W]|uniref:hypothetical protein n=1 Tax=Undibacterium sp. SXout7W TaxID=3413049 RepID=UPI003BF1333D
MRIAFYAANHDGLPGIYNRLVKWWTRGRYSHVEILFTDGLCASSSFMDGGVRFKHIDLDIKKWEFITVPDELEPAARAWFEQHQGQKYDVLGNVHFILSIVVGEKRKWFCSEAVAAALGIREPWRFDPNRLAAILRSMPPEGGFFTTTKKKSAHGRD